MVPSSLAGLPEHLPRPPPSREPIPPAAHPTPSTSSAAANSSDSADTVHRASSPPSPNPIDTRPNQFGVFRRYASKPQRDPEEGLSFEDFADAASHSRPLHNGSERNPLRPFGSTVAGMLHHAKDAAAKSYAPFLNWSAFKLMQWQYTGSMTKSSAELQRLVDGVLTHPDFKAEDLAGFNVEQAKRRLDDFGATGGAFSAEDGWREASVTLRLPKERHTHTSEANSPKFIVDNIWVRRFTEVLKAGYRDTFSQKFHWFPFHFLHRTRQDRDTQSTRLFTDIYNSDAMIKEDEAIQKRARDARDPSDGPDVEYVVGAIGVYSDSTHLANFGTSSLWPIYAFFTNLSKYLRSKPTMFAAHHLAYIPSVCGFAHADLYNTKRGRLLVFQLPTTLSHAYESKYGEPPSSAVLRLLKHDLMQKIWLLLLDDEFMAAYEHGMKLICGDGVTRRIFPRIFTYSADYPEKYVSTVVIVSVLC